MIKNSVLTIALIAIISINTGYCQNSSVLASGNWVRLEITSSEIYKLSYSDLISYGMNPEGIDPKNIRIFGNGSGMLPQANNIARPIDLTEISIFVSGTADNSFDPEDYILFYGLGPDKITFDSLNKLFNYQNHLFTNSNFYFLNVDQSPGKRVKTSIEETAGTSLSSAYSVSIHEEDLYNILHSGREWYGEKFDLVNNMTFQTQEKNIQGNSEITIISSVMSSSLQNSNFKVELNGVEIGNQPIPANPNGTYSTKGTSRIDVLTTNKSSIDDNDLAVEYTFEKESGAGYLNYFLIQSLQLLRYSNGPLSFYMGALNHQGNVSLSVADCPENLLLWEISSHDEIKNIPYTRTGSTLNFNSSTKSKEYILFDPTTISSSISQSQEIPSQNLHATRATDLLIVAPEMFQPLASYIAELRSSEGLNVTIATPEQIYNEFSSGKVDVSAIRDYAKLLYDEAGLRYLLILGKGTYDPKDIIGTQKLQVPIYESRNSLQPLATYGSDDYLGFLEDSEGEWSENPVVNHTLDISVGRIPLTSLEEADNYLNKLTIYSKKEAIGQWRKKIVFVAENGDGNIHQRDAERLATLVDTTYSDFNTKKIYVDAYPIEVNPGSNKAPKVNEEIYTAINNGALIVNYTGHGDETQWAKTRIFDTLVIDSLDNNFNLPLFVTATCEFGRHDDTGTRSGAEDLLVKNETGAIATISTARPVFASANYRLNDAFYKQVFKQTDGEYLRLGDIFKNTKNNSLAGVGNRNFSLLGDPSMFLSYPNQSITIDSLNNKILNGNDTLNALSELHFIGHVRNPDNSIDISFNGDLEVSFLDIASNKQTLGNLGGTPFDYKVRDNILFKGRVSVIDGSFGITTVLPKDISYNPRPGKIALYAQNYDSTRDGSGSNIEIMIGKSSENSIVDIIPPTIELFLGDTSYIAGGVVNPNTLLIAKLYDENGINTSTNQVGHSITYSLDNALPIEVNEFYSSIKDDYTKGWVYYNLPKLTSGNHNIDFTAWDTSNNSTTKSIEFYVSVNGEIVISDLSNYPNPMKDLTTFTFAHNLGGEEVEVSLEIINSYGQVVYRQTKSYISAPTVINNWVWDGRNATGGKMASGIYIYGINLRSKLSTLTQNKYSRLFITN